MTRRWTARLSVCLIAAMAMVGCSDEREASDSLPSASSSASPTEEELPPLGPEDMPMPDEARTQDAAGAEAFVRYYIELINRTSTVMDAEPLREFSDGCPECDRIADDTQEDAAAGYRYEGGQISITWIESTEPEPLARVSFTADQAALRVVDQSGEPVPNLSFDSLSQRSSGATAQWDEARQSWVVTGLTLG